MTDKPKSIQLPELDAHFAPSSYKDQRKELGLAPAGSVADHHSTQDGSKWHHGVDAAGIGKLGKIAKEINDITDKTATVLAKAQINVGRLLLEARELIPGDLQFGQWREKNTAITNKTTANKLMNLAKQIGDGRITQDLLDGLPMSTLKELISAPDSVVSHIRMLLKEDEVPVTRDTVRDAIKESKEPLTIEDAEFKVDGKVIDEMAPDDRKPSQPQMAERKPTAPSTPNVPKMGASEILEQQIKIIAMPTLTRLRVLKDYTPTKPYPGCKPLEWAWLVLGLDPNPAIVPNKTCLHHVVQGELSTLDSVNADDGEALIAAVHRAADLITKEEY